MITIHKARILRKKTLEKRFGLQKLGKKYTNRGLYWRATVTSRLAFFENLASTDFGINEQGGQIHLLNLPCLIERKGCV